MCERVTWGSCPNCGARAAVGWIGDEVTEADCHSECDLTNAHIRELRRLSDAPAAADD
jgi:hypothetical protein